MQSGILIFQARGLLVDRVIEVEAGVGNNVAFDSHCRALEIGQVCADIAALGGGDIGQVGSSPDWT